jgi:DNA polymerase III epsilon subunit-like protein
MKLLIFDTETTGLPLDRNSSILATDRWPYIVQLSYLLYDNETHTVIEKLDTLINIKDNIIIPPDTTKIHGITNQMCRESGRNIKEILTIFNNVLLKADILIAHNLQFDKNMLKVEYIRNRLTHNFLKLNKPIPEFCTMQHSIELCSIYRINKYGNSYKKYPKLIELYQKLFNETPDGLHNAMADVIVCLRCYCKMQLNIDILEQSSELIALSKSYLLNN